MRLVLPHFLFNALFIFYTRHPSHSFLDSPSLDYRLEITEVDRAVLSLKTQRRRLEDHRTRVTTQIERETLVARQLVASGHKDRAMLALKKKRLQETTLGKLDAFLLNVESMVSNNSCLKFIITILYIPIIFTHIYPVFISLFTVD